MSNVIPFRPKAGLDPQEERRLKVLNTIKEAQRRMKAVRAHHNLPPIDEAAIDARLRRMGMLDD
jgi:hypothetical protein